MMGHPAFLLLLLLLTTTRAFQFPLISTVVTNYRNISNTVGYYSPPYPKEDTKQQQQQRKKKRIFIHHPSTFNVTDYHGGSSTWTKTETDKDSAITLPDAAAIVAGTAIGGGFLALPSVTTPIGYGPTVGGLVLAWLFLVGSSWAFCEAAGHVSSSSTTTSLATVLQRAFGPQAAWLGGLGFVLQMLAVVTAQIVKGAELLAHLTGIPYVWGCWIPPLWTAFYVFHNSSSKVEGTNTALTTTMLGGFAALIMGTIVSGGNSSGAFSRSDWRRLLPHTASTSWAMPVFINLLCFGQAMPMIVERMMQRGGGGETNTNNKNTNVSPTATTKALLDARWAATIGSSIPLLMCLVWAAIATALVPPNSTMDPLFSLLDQGPAIRIPVCLLSVGAIGTTLLGSFLALGHFVADVVSSSSSTTHHQHLSQWLTTLIPCLFACWGPTLYLPLLAFAGAYPTTILHGLVPAWAALRLRRRAPQQQPYMIPGMVLRIWMGMGLALVGASTALNFSSLR